MEKRYTDKNRMHTSYIGEYFDWLCDKINLDYNKYEMLIIELYNVEFKSIIELDSNRVYDGIIVRGEYLGERDNHTNENLSNKPCSVLEGLIGLARRFDYILDDADRGDRSRIWFWEMIDNLGLSIYTNDYLEKPFGRRLSKTNDIFDICEKWLSRSFDYNGLGSPFPLKHPNNDQRNVDMMMQLNGYIMENYMVNDELM